MTGPWDDDPPSDLVDDWDPFLVDDDGWDDVSGAGPSDDATGSEDRKQAKKSVATQLVELAEQHYRLAVSQQGDPVAFLVGGPNLAHPLRGGRLGLRAALAKLYMDATGRAASSSALADALLVIEGKAHDADEVNVSQRAGRHHDSIVVDLGTPDGRAVVVTPNGWSIVDRSPIPFTRSALTASLCDPIRSDLDLFASPIGNVDAQTWRVLLGWMTAAFVPDIAHPIVLFGGEQGTGKTTFARRVVDVLDPSTAPVRSVPRDLPQWVTAAAGSLVVALDNISGVREWLSDAMCRAATGEGYVSRRLYTDADLAVIQFRRCVILTAIDSGALRGDLAERVLPIELARIDSADRRTDADLEDRWKTDRPRVLGALFDLLADVLSVLDDVHLDDLPRMADFAKVLAAVDRVRPVSTPGTPGALDHYLQLTEGIQASVVDDDPVAAAIVELVTAKGGLEHTAQQLLDRLTVPDPRPRSWPTSARGMGGHVRRIAPALRAVGIEVETGRVGDRRTFILTPTDKGRNQRAERAGRAQTHESQDLSTARREGQRAVDAPQRAGTYPDVPDETPGQGLTARSARSTRPLSADTFDTTDYETDYEELFQ